MTQTFSKSAFYSFGDIPLADPLPLIFSQVHAPAGETIQIQDGDAWDEHSGLYPKSVD